MSSSEVLLLAFLIGVIAGLRSLTAPAVVAYGAHKGWLNLTGTRLAWMGRCGRSSSSCFWPSSS
jgi:uncharacterized membrane protein